MATVLLSQPFIILTALAIGLLMPSPFVGLGKYATILLQIIFFISALQIDLRGLLREVVRREHLIFAVITNIIITPIIVWPFMNFWFPEFAIGLLLLAAVPAGMVSPFLTKLVRGNVQLSLIIVVTTSLLAPLTIPLILKILVGTVVTVDYGAMLLKIVTIIVIPFLLAELVRLLATEKLGTIPQKYFQIGSLACFITFLLGIVSSNADTIRDALTLEHSTALFSVFFTYIFFHFIGLHTLQHVSDKDKRAIVVTTTYNNNTLALLLATSFFPNSTVVTITALSYIPWSLLFILYDVWVLYGNKIFLHQRKKLVGFINKLAH